MCERERGGAKDRAGQDFQTVNETREKGEGRKKVWAVEAQAKAQGSWPTRAGPRREI